MRLMNETNEVSVTIWQTYVEGFTFSEDRSPHRFKEVLFANVKSERAAENYLRSKLRDSHLSVMRIERFRGKWRVPLEDFLEIADLVSESN